jgi:hypothetical protein
MTQVSCVLFLSIAIASGVSCGSDDIGLPPPGFPHATATRTGAPNDGPAIAIYLSATAVETLEPSTSHVGVAIWQSLDALSGRSLSVAPTSAEGAGWYYATPLGFESALRGNVTVLSVSADNRVRGTVDVTFPMAGRIRGGFDATWISRPRLCG